MTTISAKLIQKSKSIESGKEISTVECRYPRAIHAELMTHRVFSRNSASSRAIPIPKLIKDVIADPFIPLHVGKHQKGMQADQELTGFRRWAVIALWKTVMWIAIVAAFFAYKLGVHKQVINRMLEPWAHITVLVTSTEWNNFFALREHKDAEPHIQKLATVIHSAIKSEEALEIAANEWHVPYVDRTRDGMGFLVYHDNGTNFSLEDAKLISAARSASTSYKTVDGKPMDRERALKVAENLTKADVIHASPFEHQATPDEYNTKTKKYKNPSMHGNFVGFKQYRKYLPNESVSG